MEQDDWLVASLLEKNHIETKKYLFVECNKFGGVLPRFLGEVALPDPLLLLLLAAFCRLCGFVLVVAIFCFLFFVLLLLLAL